LAGGIAHDFNNILTGILANISFAKILLEPDHKICTPLAEAEKASRRAAELAQQLLTFARGGEPNKKVISPNQLIRDAVSLMLRGSNVKARLDIEDMIYAVEADEGQISQVLNNLLINAIQAMPNGGELDIAAVNCPLQPDNKFGLEPGHYIKITLQDQGGGIPVEIKEKIFDPYFTTKTEGTGLGLASAFSIIYRHGGHLSVDSIEGKGSIFTICLPSLKESYTDHIVASPKQATPRHGGNILLMDDDEMIREVAKHILCHLGYEVTLCANGEDAIELFKLSMESDTPYKAVIMDLTIPGGLGGKQTAERLLALFPAACLIVSSGYSQDPIMANYRQYGFQGAIAKPYSIQEFDQVLGALPPLHNQNNIKKGL